MTRNAIPILTDEGVQAITIGVNGGSAPPGVPKNTPFIWRDRPSGKEIITAVHPGKTGSRCDSKHRHSQRIGTMLRWQQKSHTLSLCNLGAPV